MRTSFPVLPIATATLARAFVAISTAVAVQVKALARARRHRKEANALAGLDPAMLKDMGITRADLNDAFSSPFWDDPTSLLRERAIERRVNRVTLNRVPAPQPDAKVFRQAAHHAA